MTEDGLYRMGPQSCWANHKRNAAPNTTGFIDNNFFVCSYHFYDKYKKQKPK